MGQNPTTFEAWSGPSIGGPALTRPNFGKVKKSVTDVSAISPDILIIAFHFSLLKRQAGLFPECFIKSLSHEETVDVFYQETNYVTLLIFWLSIDACFLLLHVSFYF